jgi:thioredoxin 1
MQTNTEVNPMRRQISRALVLSLMIGTAGATFACGQTKKTLPAPTEKRVIYPENADAKAEIAEALANAAKTHRRVILVFGGNWCYDCHVLDTAFRSAEIAPIVSKSFIVVHVNIGEYDKNLDLAEKYDVPLKKGVPASAVLESDGTLLYSQKHGEFESARSMSKEDVLAFLEKWKPTGR